MTLKWLEPDHSVCSISLPIENYLDIKKKEKWNGIQGGDKHFNAFVQAPSDLTAWFDGKLFEKYIRANGEYLDSFFLVEDDHGTIGVLVLKEEAIILAPLVTKEKFDQVKK